MYPTLWLLLAGILLGAGLLWLARRTGPRAGQIWWAQVPYTDGHRDRHGERSKLRPVFIAGAGVLIRVAPITSQTHRRGQRGYVEIPAITSTRTTSFVNTGQPQLLPRTALRNNTGMQLPSPLVRQLRRQLR